MCPLTNQQTPDLRLSKHPACSGLMKPMLNHRQTAFSSPATFRTDCPHFLSSLRRSEWMREHVHWTQSIHWRQRWTKQSTPFTSLEEVGGGALGLALDQAAYHGQCVPRWCHHRISIRRGGRERQGGGGGLHHSAMMGGDEQDVRCCQTQLEFLTETKNGFWCLTAGNVDIKKALWLTKSKPDKSFMGPQKESNPAFFYSLLHTNMWDRQKCSGFWVVEQSRGIIEHNFHVMRSAQQPTLSLPQLHFSGKSILSSTSYFRIRPTKTSHHLDFSWTNTHSWISFFPCQFPVSCHQVQFMSKDSCCIWGENHVLLL